MALRCTKPGSHTKVGPPWGRLEAMMVKVGWDVGILEGRFGSNLRSTLNHIGPRRAKLHRCLG
eukprot:2559944-Karenia_brevis.AAC.1